MPTKSSSVFVFVTRMAGRGCCSGYTSLDFVRARSFLEAAKSDPGELHNAVTDCYFDGSIAASEAAGLFLRSYIRSPEKAVQVARIVKSLPTAVPNRNANSLASLCAFLATSFEDHECRAPLTSFAYAGIDQLRSSIRAVIDELEDITHRSSIHIDVILSRIRGFLSAILESGSDRERNTVLRGLLDVSSLLPAAEQQNVVTFLLDVNKPNSLSRPEHTDEDEVAYLEFQFIAEVAPFAKDNDCMKLLMLRYVVASYELGCAYGFRSLWKLEHRKAENAISSVGYDVFLYLMALTAADKACKGYISSCHSILEDVLVIAEIAQGQGATLLPVTSSTVSNICVAVGSLCTAGGADDTAKIAAKNVRLIRRVGRCNRNEVSRRIASAELACRQSALWNCPVSSLAIGILLKLSGAWDVPDTLSVWLDRDMQNMMKNGGLWVSEKYDTSGFIESVVTKDNPGSGSANLEYNFMQQSRNLSVAIPIAAAALTSMSHSHERVRLSAVGTVSGLHESSVHLFFLPTVMKCLQEERNGVVAVKILSDLILSPALLKKDETASIALSALIRLIQRAEGHMNAATYQSGIVALARAADYAPRVACSFLLQEVEKLKISFKLIRSPVRIAAAAAVLQIVNSRPALGPNFVPFITLCISVESIDVAPKAAAFCFESMAVMAEESVLDAVKAVKVVLKSFPHVRDVAPGARGSYLQFLGCVAMRSESKKGKLLTETIIRQLRECITGLHPESTIEDSMFLTWEEVGKSAAALHKFRVDDILRISFSKDEPLPDIEAEKDRKERIEQNCMTFAKSIVSVAGMSFRALEHVTSNNLCALAQSIVRSEWDNRIRSSYDAERIARLRATSEALRRARASKGRAAHNTVGDNQALDGFLRAVEAFPVGVVKGIAEQCVMVEKRGAEYSEDCAIALRVLGMAGAVSPALPWVSMSEEVLGLSPNAQYRAGCLFVLRLLGDDGVAVSEGRQRWFGAQSPLCYSSSETDLAEAKQLFLGMVQHYPQDALAMLSRHGNSLSPETIDEFVCAIAEIRKSESCLETAMSGLCPIICDPNNGWAKSIQLRIENNLFEDCLQHCSLAFVNGLFFGAAKYNESVLRLACRFGDFGFIRRSIHFLLQSESTSGVDEALTIIGNAVQLLKPAERREIVTDICASEHGRTGIATNPEVKIALATVVLGVGALLPNAKAGLIAVPSIWPQDEREGVSRLVAVVLNDDFPED